MFKWLHAQSISTRILLATTVGISSALLVVALAYFFWNRYAQRRFVVDNLSATAEVVGDGLHAPLAFGDREAADLVLRSLASKPEVEVGCVYDQQGQLFVQYRVTQSMMCPSGPPGEGAFDGNDKIVLSRAVMQEGRPIGTLYLRRSSDDIEAQSTEQMIFLALISALSLVVGLVTSGKLQRVVSSPIVRLAETTRRVSEQNDYSLHAIKDTGGEIGTLVDAFNTMLDQIEARTGELQKAIQSRDDFLSIAAHELRNPVNAIQLQLLSVLRAAQRGAQPLTYEWVSERVGQASAQVNRLVRLLDNLLDASRMADHGVELEPEDIDFASVVRAVVDRFEEEPTNRLIALDVMPVMGRWDKLRLDQIVTNLLSNAFKYGNGQPIVVSLTADSETACLSVTDHGIGIDPERQEKLFTRFERAVSKQHYGGFGLGLWITRNAVEAMGGHISVHSQPGEGSTFRIELPRKNPWEGVQAGVERPAERTHPLKSVV